MNVVMKSLFAVTLAFCFSVVSVAQDNTFSFSGYIKDAVPMVEGKVVLSREVNTNKFKGNELKELIKMWMNDFVKDKKDNKSQVAIEDVDKGLFVAVIEDWLIFSSNAISLDRATVRYQLTANVSEDKCILTIEKIKFNYRESNYRAAEVISDKIALNKKGNNIKRGYKKWRIKSLDYFRSVFANLEDYLGKARVDKILKENS